MPIQLFRPVYDVDACLAQIRECLDRGWTGQGFKTDDFEDAWKKYTGHPHALMLTSGTAALNLAVETLKEANGWQDGDEIISTPLTFVATNNCILFANLTPVFADIDDSLCLDPADVERRITPRTRAVIFVGMGGNCGQYDAVLRLCRRHGLKLILDAAHMAGTRLNGRQVGLDADAACYSFHVSKPLSTAESGMLCMLDAPLHDIVCQKAFNGIDRTHAPNAGVKVNTWDYDVKYLADAYNGNSIMAAIALAQLPLVDAENAVRRANARRYDALFAPHADRIRLVETPAGCESAQWIYQIQVENRDGLMAHLKSLGIGCSVHYPVNTLYAMYRHLAGTCPKAEAASEHLITLPVHQLVTEADIRMIAETVINFVSK